MIGTKNQFDYMTLTKLYIVKIIVLKKSKKFLKIIIMFKL